MESISIWSHFSSLADPRVERTRQHSLHDILVIAICAIIGGADDWVSIEDFGNSKLQWFKTFLDLPIGIEGFIYSFFIGGIAAVAYAEIAHKRVVKTKHFHHLFFSLPHLSF